MLFVSFRRQLFLFSLLLISACTDPSDTLTKTDQLNRLQTKTVTLNTDSLGGVGVQQELIGRPINSKVRKPPVYIPQGIPEAAPAHANVRPAGQPAVIPIPKPLVSAVPGRGKMKNPESFEVQTKQLAIEQPGAELALPPRIEYTATHDLQYLDVDQGILSSYIRYLMEDSKGYLWIATSFGVSRYDGNSFLHYTTSKGLPKDMGLFIMEDRQGWLWFGMKDGVCSYDGRRFMHYLEGMGTINAITEDANGNLWFGGENGLFLYQSKNERPVFQHYTTSEGLLDNRITTLLSDQNSNLWIGSLKGLTYFDGTAFTHLDKKSGLADEFVSSLAEDDLGRIWVGTNNGLDCFTPPWLSQYAGGEIMHFTTKEGLNLNKIKFILIDSKKRLWIASSRGLTSYDGHNFTNYATREGLNTFNTRSLVEDKNGNLWIGTGGGGVSHLNLNSFYHFFPHERLLDNGVMALAKNSTGQVWFGTGKGAVLYDDSLFTYFTPKEGLIHLEVLAILEDSQGNTWFGTPAGASRYDGKGFTNYTSEQGLSEGEVYAIIEDSWGRIWLGTDHGLSCFDPKGEEIHFTNYSTEGGLMNGKIKTLYEDQQKNLWVCTSRGVSRCEPYTDEHGQVRYTVTGFFPDTDVRAVLEDPAGHLWFGTVGDGVYILDPTSGTQDFLQINTRHGLSSNTIWSLLEDPQGNIWMSTELGITMVQLLPQETPLSVDAISGELSGARFFTFYKEQGLRKLDFQTNSACLDAQNRMWWGTVGTTMLDLDNFIVPTAPPNLVELNQVDIHQNMIDYHRLEEPDYRSTLPFGSELARSFTSVSGFANYPDWMKLPYSLNHLTFHFAAIDWSAPQKIRYQYYLEGLEKDWSIPSRQASADYRNLPPGSYTFKLKAAGEVGNWSEPFTYDFAIRPPWWQTTWAYLAYGLTFFGIAFGIFSFFRNRLLLKHSLEMKQKEASRLQEMDILRTRFFTNVSHELRTPLSLLLAPVKTLLQTGQLTEKQFQLLQIARRSGKQLEYLINQILDLRKLETGNLQVKTQATPLAKFFRRYMAQFESLAEQKRIEFSTSILLGESNVVMIDQEKCRQIIFNLLSNAFKFTPEGGWIEAGMDLKKETLQITVADSGPGIHPDDLPHLFNRYFQTNRPEKPAEGGTGIGLALCREYAELLGGEIEVESSLGKGTSFQVQFPVVLVGRQELIGVGEPAALEVWNSQSNRPHRRRQAPLLSVPVENREKPTILVVEDNPDLQEYLQLILRENYEVLIAGNGREALHCLQTSSQCHLILSDLMMPVMDGLQLLEQLRANDTTRHLPVIMLTARAEAQDKLRALRIGVDDYLSKPFEEEELMVRIGNLLKNQAIRNAEIFSEDPLKKDIPFLSKPDQDWLEAFEDYVRQNLSLQILSVPQLADEFAMSESTLLRQLKRLTGLSPIQYLQEMRLNEARQLLESRRYRSISRVASEVGYKDARSFSRGFKKRFGKLPSDFLID